MESIGEVVFNTCDDVKCIEAAVTIEDEGELLRIPVYLTDVCPCRDIIVGVFIYIDGIRYAMKTKKVFTGGRPYCRKIREFYVDEFLFLLTDVCEEDVCIDVLAHYIY